MARATVLLALLVTLVIGMGLGRYVFPYSGTAPALPDASAHKCPLGQSPDLPDLADALSPDRQLLQVIFQHEEDLRNNPDNAESWEHLGNLYFGAREPKKSIRAYTSALELRPDNTNVLADCGVMYRQLREYDMALQYFRKALDIDPNHQRALFNSGVLLYFDLERKEEGLNFWRELIKINPTAKTPSGDPVSKLIADLL